jgi:hypothetical protein
MNKIIITQYRQEHCGSTLGAFEYHFGINYNGNYAYSVITTSESMMYMIEALRRGNDVEFIKAWEKVAY